MPLGGTEENSGYKGTGLAMLVDIFSGVLSGAAYGPNVKTPDSPEPLNLGQCYIAINPACFVPNFQDRLSDFMNYIRNMPPADPSKPISIPGDSEKNIMANIATIGGLRYSLKQLDICRQWAEKLNIKPMIDVLGRTAGIP